MEIVLALTIAARLADLAIGALNGIASAAETYGRVRPVIDRLRAENRDPTADEWKTINTLFDDAFNHLMTD